MNPTPSQLRWTGLFLAGGIALVAVSLVFLLGSRLSRHQLALLCEVRGQSVSGLATGSKVSLRGIDVGTVTSMAFDPKDPERILVGIEVDPEAPIYRDATATLEIFGITGLKYLELVPGNPKLGRPAEGTVLATRPSQTGNILNMLDTVTQASARVLKNIENLTRQDSRERIDTILADLGRTTRDFSSLSAELRDAHLGDQANQAGRKINALVDRLDSTLKAIKPGTSMAKLDSATTAVSSVARRADLMLGRSQGDIYRTLEELSTTMRNLSDFSQTIRNNPASLLRPGERDKR